MGDPKRALATVLDPSEAVPARLRLEIDPEGTSGAGSGTFGAPGAPERPWEGLYGDLSAIEADLWPSELETLVDDRIEAVACLREERRAELTLLPQLVDELEVAVQEAERLRHPAGRMR